MNSLYSQWRTILGDEQFPNLTYLRPEEHRQHSSKHSYGYYPNLYYQCNWTTHTNIPKAFGQTNVLTTRETNGFILPKNVRDHWVIGKEFRCHRHQEILWATFLKNQTIKRLYSTLYQFSPPIHLKSSEEREFPIRYETAMTKRKRGMLYISFAKY